MRTLPKSVAARSRLCIGCGTGDPAGDDGRLLLNRGHVTSIVEVDTGIGLSSMPWKRFIDTHPDVELRKQWTEAVKFFGANRDRFASIRNDIGRHYPEKAAAYAVDQLKPRTFGSLVIVSDESGADAKLEFATELVASVLMKNFPNQEPTEEEWTADMNGVFTTVLEGWEHAVKAVHIVIAAFLAPRVGKD